MRLVNFDEVRRGHEKFLAENERLIREESERAGKHSVEHVKRYPGFKPRTGNLQRRQGYKILRIGKSVRIVMTNTAKYAEAIDTGAKKHLIRPRRRRFLRFVPRGGTSYVFARLVRHPGNKPYKFGWRATNSAYRVLGQNLKHRMTEAASRF